MGLETATYVSDLDASNPLASDKKNQGDDHFRLIKTVLKTSLPNLSRAFRIPEVVAKTANYSALVTDDQKTILCDVSAGAININLPAGLPFGGWTIRVIKTDFSVNPVFVVPPSGTINNFAKIRINIPNAEHVFLWTGSVFLRLTTNENPAGELFYVGGPAAPVGYAQAVGQSIIRADFPELFGAWGTTWGAVDGAHFNAPNSLDRFLVGSGSAYAVGATGGENFHTLTVAELPPHDHGGVTGGQNQSHTHTDPSGSPLSKVVNYAGFSAGGGQTWFGDGGTGSTGVASQDHAHSIPSAGSGNSHENRPPYLALPLVFRLC